MLPLPLQQQRFVKRVMQIYFPF